MRVILTHEQADFDAVASMLGASLLDDSAVPVLPRRRNRNVNAFITLYGTTLPFIEVADLGDEPIDLITLVDTQSLVSLKGVEAEYGCPRHRSPPPPRETPSSLDNEYLMKPGQPRPSLLKN